MNGNNQYNGIPNAQNNNNVGSVPPVQPINNVQGGAAPIGVAVQPAPQVVPQQNGPKIIQTDEGNITGQNQCPKCGSTEIVLNVKTGKLKCEFCRAEFDPKTVDNMVTDISKLEGQIYGSGAADIQNNKDDGKLMTLKCSSCGSEVVINTEESTQARCHWCRSTLSINQQIPNGAVPDMVLPFRVPKEMARGRIEQFVGKRKFFAHPKFKAEFTTNNIMGVYFPYMLVDVNAHSHLVGQGEHLVRRYTVKVGDSEETRYDADLYAVERDFDITIEGLTVESNLDRLNTGAKDKTNNIINSIMPFDIENCVKYDSNYLKGYTSERRDTNVDNLRVLVSNQSKDIARFAANDSLKFYDRGVNWQNEQLNIKGQQWKAAYLPVWLYSYQEVKGNTKLLHYVAVNARTQETMGSIPIHMPKLVAVSAIIEFICLLLMIWVDGDYSWLFLFGGPIYFGIMYSRYRNSGARHKHELETKRTITNLKSVDNFVKHEKGLSNASIRGCNNTSIIGGKQSIVEQIASANGINNIINKK